MTAILSDVVNYVSHVFWGDKMVADKNLTKRQTPHTSMASSLTSHIPTFITPFHSSNVSPLSSYKPSFTGVGFPSFYNHYHSLFYPVLNHIYTTPNKNLNFFRHSCIPPFDFKLSKRPPFLYQIKPLPKTPKSYLTDTLTSLRRSSQFATNPSLYFRSTNPRLATLASPAVLALVRSNFNTVMPISPPLSSDKSKPNMKSEETQTDDNPYVI